MNLRRAFDRTLVGAAALSFALGAPVQAAPLASAVKAAYLFKMAAFVSWPPSAFGPGSSAFRICVMNRDDVARPLSEIARGQQAWGRPIAVERIDGGLQRASQCQILFAGDARPPVDDNAPVLTVTDGGSSASSGVVQFTTDQAHVRFVIHRAQADTRKLQISSKLLAVAQQVVP